MDYCIEVHGKGVWTYNNIVMIIMSNENEQGSSNHI